MAPSSRPAVPAARHHSTAAMHRAPPEPAGRRRDVPRAGLACRHVV